MVLNAELDVPLNPCVQALLMRLVILYIHHDFDFKFNSIIMEFNIFLFRHARPPFRDRVHFSASLGSTSAGTLDRRLNTGAVSCVRVYICVVCKTQFLKQSHSKNPPTSNRSPTEQGNLVSQPSTNIVNDKQRK